MEDIEELMTPPEKEAVTKVQNHLAAIQNNIFQVSETMFLFQLYLELKTK